MNSFMARTSVDPVRRTVRLSTPDLTNFPDDPLADGLSSGVPQHPGRDKDVLRELCDATENSYLPRALRRS